MTYFVNASYTMSNLGALEKKALPWQDINDKGLSRKHAEEVLKILK